MELTVLWFIPQMPAHTAVLGHLLRDLALLCLLVRLLRLSRGEGLGSGFRPPLGGPRIERACLLPTCLRLHTYIEINHVVDYYYTYPKNTDTLQRQRNHYIISKYILIFRIIIVFQCFIILL